jgi:DNA-directed RNA polymerase specialized sigma24 family protein
MASTHPDIVPTDIGQLNQYYRAYIAGGVRRNGIDEQEIDDVVQDIMLHCAMSNFFARIQDYVDKGEMSPSRFRSYLSRTLTNCLKNRYNKNGRNPAIGALSTSAPMDDEARGGAVDLDRLQQEEQADAVAIPAEVLEDDLILYIADRKPHFLPTFILMLESYKASEIAQIIDKRKETVHYRIRILQGLVTEYLEGDSKGKRVSKAAGPVYSVVGDENPFNRGASYHLWQQMQDHGAPVSIKDLNRIAQKCMDQGDFKSTRNPESVVGTFLAYALEKDAICEDAASTGDGGGRTSSVGARVRYVMVSTECPYKHWGMGAKIFPKVLELGTFTHDDLTNIVNELIASGDIKGTRRTPDSLARGFVETARGYGVLANTDEVDRVVNITTTAAPKVTSVTVNSPAARTSKDEGDTYKLNDTPNPYTSGINYELWNHFLGKEFRRADIEGVITSLKADGTISSSRPDADLAYSFWRRIRSQGALEVATKAPDPKFTLNGDNPYQRGINFEVWERLSAKGEWTKADIESIIDGLRVGGDISSSRPTEDLAYSFWIRAERKQAVNPVA